VADAVDTVDAVAAEAAAAVPCRAHCLPVAELAGARMGLADWRL
jgi:hypothetical protein